MFIENGRNEKKGKKFWGVPIQGSMVGGVSLEMIGVIIVKHVIGGETIQT